ncbi:MAG: hypothetical protein GY679_01755 [Mycoplasma sp.]|nr:hypothetical protein [Mycoplasma sp.]
MNLIDSFKLNIDKIRALENEEQAYSLFLSLRWPDGVICPCCGGKENNPIKGKKFYCRTCKKLYSLKTTTIFHACRLSCLKIFKFIQYIYFENIEVQIASGMLNIERVTSRKWRKRLNYFFGITGNATDKRRKSNPIVQLTLEGEFIAVYSTQKEAAIALKGYSSHINRALKNPNVHAYGYLWRYK